LPQRLFSQAGKARLVVEIDFSRFWLVMVFAAHCGLPEARPLISPIEDRARAMVKKGVERHVEVGFPL